MVFLNTPIESVPKISKRIVPSLRRLGIRTIRDLLFHFPARYEDFSNVKHIRDVTPNETVTIRGKILKIANRRTMRKQMILTEAIIGDETGKIKTVWFNQPFIARNLRQGQAVNFSGKAALGKDGLYLQNPAYEKLLKFNLNNSRLFHTEGLVPVYNESRGITSRWLRYLIRLFIDLRIKIPDPLPPEIRKRHLLPEIRGAIFTIHFPQTLKEAKSAERRFIFEELLLLQLRSLRERARLKERRAPAITLDIPLVKEFVSSLPFSLTDAQRKAIWEILQDISKPRPMNRLLEGDVGSGKTVVAAAAALLAVKSGYRIAILAPTEILARQHFATLEQILAPFGISVGLLTGSEKKTSNATALIVGTHALLQNKVKFDNLGLVIADEQHRFGVEQRALLLKNHGTDFMLPHFLSMSATPIPRTLALTLYGDLDLSILDEMPKSRKTVLTQVVEQEKREETYQFIRNEVKKGRQAFVICPRIELGIVNCESGEMTRTGQRKLLAAEVKTVKEEYKKLSEKIFPDLRAEMLHGKMKPKEKETLMNRFRKGEIDILVSTSVVEVGVDVPNATVMMIEGAERFGLATLHQFRGRVGRGSEQSYCFLFPTEDGMNTKRLRAVAEAKTGFELAERDLEIRGPGDLFGIQQWGTSSLILKAVNDPALVREIREEAQEIVKKSPDLLRYPGLKERLEAFEKTVHLE